MDGQVAAAEVDVLLVLAMDVSGSLGEARIVLQRRGHAEAVASPSFVRAVRSGGAGAVGLTAIEWSDAGRQRQIVPWRRIDDGGTAEDFAAALLRASRPIPGFTSISGALDFAARLLAEAPFAAARRIIDLSGNGPNHDGRPAAAARDAAVAKGITINGLPILDVIADLDAYFATQVIGGPGAFLVPARGLEDFATSIRRKLLLEVAGVRHAGPRRGPAHASAGGPAFLAR